MRVAEVLVLVGTEHLDGRGVVDVLVSAVIVVMPIMVAMVMLGVLGLIGVAVIVMRARGVGVVVVLEGHVGAAPMFPASLARARSRPGQVAGNARWHATQ